MRYLITVLLIVSSIGFTSAQTQVMQSRLDIDTLVGEYGPNLKHFWQSYFSYGLVVGPADSAGVDLQTYGSSQFQFGARYKRKLTNWFGVGVDLAYTRTAYRIAQDSGKVFATPTIHKMEKLTYDSFRAGAWMRINIGRRGNYLGNYLDLGGFGEGHFSIRHITKDEFATATASGASRNRVVNRGLVWAQPYSYGAMARIGLDKVVFFGEYRVSDLFDKSAANQYPELPRITVGIQLAPY